MNCWLIIPLPFPRPRSIHFVLANAPSKRQGCVIRMGVFSSMGFPFFFPPRSLDPNSLVTPLPCAWAEAVPNAVATTSATKAVMSACAGGRASCGVLSSKGARVTRAGSCCTVCVCVFVTRVPFERGGHIWCARTRTRACVIYTCVRGLHVHVRHTSESGGSVFKKHFKIQVLRGQE